MSEHELLQDIETFLTKTGMLPTSFGKAALNDPNLVFDLRRGRDYRRSTAVKIREFITSATDGAEAQ